MYKLFKSASWHTKLFLVLAFLIGLLTIVTCFYPYVWLKMYRGGNHHHLEERYDPNARIP